MCVRGARAAQSKVESAEIEGLKVYSVWLPMLKSDSRKACSREQFDVPETKYFWNENRAVGIWFAKNIAECKPLSPIAWDQFYLFDAEAV